METILTLAKTYEEFYVPAFAVKVNGEDLVRKLFLTVTSAEVDLNEKTVGRFSFTVANAFNWESRAFITAQEESQINLIELFEFGSEVEILLGYGDPTNLPSMINGIITEIGTSFSEGGNPELNISGYDKLHLLTIGKEAKNWEDKSDSEVVEEIVSVTGLSTEITDTIPSKPRIEKAQETSLEFMNKLAERNSSIFYVQNNTFYFGPRKNNPPADIELEWGKGLLSFSPEANLAMQVGNVEVISVSAEKGELITGRASAGKEMNSSSQSASASEQVSRALDVDTTMTVRASVHTQQEADRLAQAILDERSQDFIKGNGESIGLPEIVPNINISIKGIGKPFSQNYYISSAKHSISSSGYKTSWQAEQNNLQEASL